MTATQLVLETRALPRCLLVCVGWNGDVRSLRAVTPPPSMVQLCPLIRFPSSL